MAKAPDPEDEAALVEHWAPRLEDLAGRVRRAALGAMDRALGQGRLEAVARSVGEGAGDTTFGLDATTEKAVDEWLESAAREGPLSLLTEDSGWLHRGPAPGGGAPRDLPGFDHGGPRIAVDPIDGTRHLMLDLRPAWTVVALAGPGPGLPRQGEVIHGAVSELPVSQAAAWRVLSARRGAGCQLHTLGLADGRTLARGRLAVDGDDRVDHGYFPFFAFHPDLRPDVARLAADFFARIERHAGAEIRHCYDDQYISSGGQLVLTALGTYRMVVEARALVAERRGRPTQTCKPYDVSGAVLCAQEAGCPVTGLDGEPLDFPLDTSTSVCFAGFTNRASRARLWPHLEAALGAFRPD